MKYINIYIFIAFLLILNQRCNKDIPKEVAAIVTYALSDITPYSAKTGGEISSDGGTAVTERGVCWSLLQNPTVADNKTTDGYGSGTFNSSITGLVPGKTYYIRAYSINGVGISYGEELSITAPVLLPGITTIQVNSITLTTASCGGIVIEEGGGSVTSRGVCWSIKENPSITDNITTNGAGTGAFTSSLINLSPGITYYIRAYATNSAGTAYGSQQRFTTKSLGTAGIVSDIDGNTYPTINIGTQVWMAENLRTTKYNDGTAIPYVADDTTWHRQTTNAYCWYKNDAATYKTTYGALYNWYTINNDKLCPTGWHVPTDEDWTILTNFLGGKTLAGAKMKETGTNLWAGSKTDDNNSSGFTGLPGGYRKPNGTYFGNGYYSYCWSSTESNGNFALSQCLSYENNYAYKDFGDKRYGLSVRCVKDSRPDGILITKK